MPKVMQNLVVLMEPSEDAESVSSKAGTMILNRFCIDEDAAFELSGVNYLKKSSYKMNTAEIKAENFQITRIVMSKVMQNLVVLMDPPFGRRIGMG